MINASITMYNKDKWYDIGGYDKLSNIVNEFKNFYNLTIHSIGEHEKTLSFSFKGDFALHFTLGKYTNYTVELYYSKSDINIFKEKYEKLTEIVNSNFEIK